MQKPVFIAVSALVLLSLSGCVSVHHLPLTQETFDPREVHQVEILGPQMPVRSHRQLALIEGISTDRTIPSIDIIREMRQRAAQFGADALVLRGREEAESGTVGMVMPGAFPMFMALSSSRRTIMGIAIRWEEPKLYRFPP